MGNNQLRHYNRPLFPVLALALIMIISMPSCSNESNYQSAVDTVTIIDQKVIGNTEYHLVLRVAGWHDKTEIIELYDAKPTFDKCAKSDIGAVYGDSLGMNKIVSHLFLDSKISTLNIEYGEGEPSKDHNNKLRIEHDKT